MMFRLQIGLLFGGLFLGYLGVQEYRVSMGTSSEPASLELKFVERGQQAPTNNHVIIGEHIADYADCIYEYEEGSGHVTHTYYPIMSEIHPYFSELDKLASKYGNLDNVPDEVWPAIDSIKVLVKTERFNSEGSIPDGLQSEEQIQGLVINLVESLGWEEKRMIQESFPGLDLDQVLIVEDGRRPASMASSFGMMFGGGFLSLAGVGLFCFGGFFESNPC